MLRIAVGGMWHLGSVTAACLASAGHSVIGIDEDAAVIEALSQGQPPISERGLTESVAEGIAAGRLNFSTTFDGAADADVVWIAWDTPVDSDDRADVDFVHSRALRLLSVMRPGALMVISSQMPVGSVARLERELHPAAVDIACAPENLRLGNAISVFLQPDRVILGTRTEAARKTLQSVYDPFTDKLEWMSVESAEMTKHAINSFLATSICFINEIAAVCERNGADALEVERGLKTDQRIGPKSYLHAGSAFAGGTLARDIMFLRSLGTRDNLALPLFNGVYASNEHQKLWLRARITEVLPSLHDAAIGILGLTYKPGTNTLRRSSAVELAQWLTLQGAGVKAFDPLVSEIPGDIPLRIELCSNAQQAMSGVAALVVMTPWPEFLSLSVQSPPPLVFDPSRFMEKIFAGRAGTRYFTIGKTN